MHDVCEVSEVIAFGHFEFEDSGFAVEAVVIARLGGEVGEETGRFFEIVEFAHAFRVEGLEAIHE